MLGASAGSLVTFSRYRGIIREFRKALESSSPNLPRERGAKRSYGMKALIVARDPEVRDIFSRLFSEIQIDTQHCTFESEAIASVMSEKFEALVVDMDVSGSAQILQSLQRTRPNQNVAVFAVAVGARAEEMASVLPSAIIIEKPFTPSEVRERIGSLYGRMLRDRLAYFRLALELPISIRKESGRLLHCTMINLSQSGMAVSAPCSFEIGESLNIVFAIPNSDVFVSGDGTVIWDDKHGKAGILFRCTSSSVQERLFEWLHDQFFLGIRTGNAEAKASKAVAVGS
jgi:CheY-like chemotaxis protein